MQERLLNLKNEALAQILEARDLSELEKIRVEYLGKSAGQLTAIIKKIPSLPENERGIVGRFANEVKKILEENLASQEVLLRDRKSQNLAETEWLDVTLPAIMPPEGHLHTQTKVLHEVLNVFKTLGYQVPGNNDIETDYYNFTALNMPPDAPSRDTQATFRLNGEKLLKTQTSAMQVRIMEKTKPPLRVVVPGKCFRVDDVDASHGFEFWQIEGMCIDKGIKMTDLLGTMEYILKQLYGEKVKVRYEATYFAFTEPSVQGVMSCTVCNQKGCPLCKNTGWVEIFPAGMIHPNVLRAGGIDPAIYTGFAFGMGLSRAVTLKYQIDDLRVLTNPDLRILKQF